MLPGGVSPRSPRRTGVESRKEPHAALQMSDDDLYLGAYILRRKEGERERK